MSDRCTCNPMTLHHTHLLSKPCQLVRCEGAPVAALSFQQSDLLLQLTLCLFSNNSCVHVCQCFGALSGASVQCKAAYSNNALRLAKPCKFDRQVAFLGIWIAATHWGPPPHSQPPCCAPTPRALQTCKAAPSNSNCVSVRTSGRILPPLLCSTGALTTTASC